MNHGIAIGPLMRTVLSALRDQGGLIRSQIVSHAQQHMPSATYTQVCATINNARACANLELTPNATGKNQLIHITERGQRVLDGNVTRKTPRPDLAVRDTNLAPLSRRHAMRAAGVPTTAGLNPPQPSAQRPANALEQASSRIRMSAYTRPELRTHTRPGSMAAFDLPSRMGDRLHYRDGRVVDATHTTSTRNDS